MSYFTSLSRPQCLVLGGVGRPEVDEAMGEPLHERDPAVGQPCKNHTTVQGDGATIEIAHKFTPASDSKILVLAPVSWHPGSSTAQMKLLPLMHFRFVGVQMLRATREKPISKVPQNTAD
jgi:hypothetical protein